MNEKCSQIHLRERVHRVVAVGAQRGDDAPGGCGCINETKTQTKQKTQIKQERKLKQILICV